MYHTQNLAYQNRTSLPVYTSGSAENYVGSLTFSDYYHHAKRHFPFVTHLIEPDHVEGFSFHEYVALMNELSWEFEDQTDGGRGVAYNIAQRNIDNRRTGILTLLRCFSESQKDIPSREKIILDVLGGDGTIARCLQSANIMAPRIITSDLSSFMINACLSQNLPCIRQSATRSLLRDSVLDGVLIAYGSHHLDKSSRLAASAEAFRTVKNGGRFVLHDFEVGKATANWFDQVVHPYSRTGHPHPHFTQNEMYALLKGAGFKNIDIFCMPDPFILKSHSFESARKKAIMHVYRMYDLVKIADNKEDIFNRLESLIANTLGEIQIEQTGLCYTATIQREALVAVGTKIA